MAENCEQNGSWHFIWIFVISRNLSDLKRNIRCCHSYRETLRALAKQLGAETDFGLNDEVAYPRNLSSAAVSF